MAISTTPISTYRQIFLNLIDTPEPDILIRGKKEPFELFDEEVYFYHSQPHTGSMCLSIPNQKWYLR